MLVLTQKVGEEIVIDGKIRVQVIGIQRRCVRIGITAPRNIIVNRAEVVARQQRGEKGPPPMIPIPSN